MRFTDVSEETSAGFSAEPVRGGSSAGGRNGHALDFDPKPAVLPTTIRNSIFARSRRFADADRFRSMGGLLVDFGATWRRIGLRSCRGRHGGTRRFRPNSLPPAACSTRLSIGRGCPGLAVAALAEMERPVVRSFRDGRAQVRRLVPEALTLDLYDGVAWLTISPSVPAICGPAESRPCPAFRFFPQLNLRTCVTMEGKPGLFYLSVDAANLSAVWFARVFFRMQYWHSAIHVQRRYHSGAQSKGANIHFRSSRLHGPAAAERSRQVGRDLLS